MEIQSKNRRVEKYLARHFKKAAFRWGLVTDPRKKRGQRWKFTELMSAVFMGLLSGCPTLRATEGVTEDLGPWGRKQVSRRTPDTTMWDLIQELSSEDLRHQHIAQVKTAWRSKELTPVGLPCGVVSIDGKGLGKLEHDANGTAQKTHNGEQSDYWLARSLRAVLVSAEGRPCLDQMAIGAKTNEMGDFSSFVDRMLDSYGDNNDLFEIISTDAGMTSKENAGHVHSKNKAYLMALKSPQQELFREAERLLSTRRKASAETPWERYRGKWVQRRLFRTNEMAGYHDWTHLRQVWRVEQTTRDDSGEIEKENRYFLTSLPWGRLNNEQCLLVVRSHWRIENDCFGTLDLQWDEDSVPWCSRGQAIEVLSWLRLMAYNLLQQARRKHLRRKLHDGSYESPPAWQRLFEWVRQVWQFSLETKANPVRR
jgi:predicted transposase YbfD/YdcC